VLLTAATVALVAALGLAGCSGGGDSASSAATTSLPRSTRIELPLGDVSADSAGAPVNVSPEQSQAVLDVLDTYLKDATVQPLRSGKPASADLGAVFDATTLTPATTTDRGVVLMHDLWKEQVERVQQGLDPLGIVRGLPDDQLIPVPGDVLHLSWEEGMKLFKTPIEERTQLYQEPLGGRAPARR